MVDIRFDGRVVIVTGAGGGLGRTYALEMARRGAAVVVNDPGASLSGAEGDRSAAQRVVDEITVAGGSAVASMVSVSTPDGAAEIVQTAIDAFGSVDVVINNAGIIRDRTVAKLEWADHDAVLAVHLGGAFYTTRAAFPHMRERGYGRFVFVSSNTGLFGNFGQASYAAAKAGVIGLSYVVSIEGARYGIAANVISPIARTRMTDEVMGERAQLVEPVHVAPMVVYLASEQCGLTHQVFSAGGGRYARVFTGLTPGWQAPAGTVATAEDVAAHLAEIRDESGYAEPRSVQDELGWLFERLPADQPLAS